LTEESKIIKKVAKAIFDDMDDYLQVEGVHNLVMNVYDYRKLKRKWSGGLKK